MKNSIFLIALILVSALWAFAQDTVTAADLQFVASSKGKDNGRDAT